MARSSALDPLDRFRFTVYIEIDGNKNLWEKASFLSVTAPRIDFQKDQYREGGRHLNPRNIVEGATFSPITLRRGKSYSMDFYNWVGSVYKAFYGSSQDVRDTSNYRGRLIIDHYNRRGKIVKKYVLEGAAPLTYIPASNFDAMNDEELSIETLIIDYEGYKEYSLPYDQIGNLFGSGVNDIINVTNPTGQERTSLPPGPEIFNDK